MSKGVSVITDDKKKPSISLTIAGTVQKFVTITPKAVRLLGSVGEEIKVSVSIVPYEGRPLKILGVEVKTGENISYKLEEIKKQEGVEYRLHVQNMRNELCRYSDTIVLKTDNEKRPEIKIRVAGEIGSEEIATITPKSVNLRGPEGEALEVSVSIVPKQKFPFQIRAVMAKKGKNIRFDLEEVKKPKGLEYRLVVRNVKNQKGRYSDTLIVRTDNKIQPQIAIKVSGNIGAEEYVTVRPKDVMLHGFPGEVIKVSVNIIPKDKYPFKIIETMVESGENINYTLEENNKPKGLEYLLTVENLKKEKGSYHDAIILKTDLQIQPEIKIRVMGNIFGKDEKHLHGLLEELMELDK